MSIWGVANPVPIGAVAAASADVACPAGETTTAINTPIGATSSGSDFQLLVDATVVITLGATAPSALVISTSAAGGPVNDSFTVPPILLVAGATLIIPVMFAGLVMRRWQIGFGAGILVTPTAQAVTVKAGSRMRTLLVTGPEV